MKEFKCHYSKCKLGRKVTDDIAIKVSNKRYHKECHQEMETLKKFRLIYLEAYPSTIYTQFNRVLNTLLEEKKIEPDFLLFTLDYILENELEVKSPCSLYYFVDSYNIKKAYRIGSIPTQKPNKLVIHSS